MKKRITDKQIRKFFWDADELPFSNKASYMLGDLTCYGVSRCVQVSNVLKSVYYEFDIYREEDSIVTLIVELPIDFTMKSIERAIFSLYRKGGTIASNDIKIFQKWKKKIKPVYSYDHAKYCATRFLEALRSKMLMNTASGKR